MQFELVRDVVTHVSAYINNKLNTILATIHMYTYIASYSPLIVMESLVINSPHISTAVTLTL